jgi:hypothetical protein
LGDGRSDGGHAGNARRDFQAIGNEEKAPCRGRGGTPSGMAETLRCPAFTPMRGCTLHLLLSVPFRVLIELTLTVLRTELILTALIIRFCCDRLLSYLPPAYWIFGHFDSPPAREFQQSRCRADVNLLTDRRVACY